MCWFESSDLPVNLVVVLHHAQLRWDASIAQHVVKKAHAIEKPSAECVVFSMQLG